MCFGCEHDTSVTFFLKWLRGQVKGHVSQIEYTLQPFCENCLIKKKCFTWDVIQLYIC